MPRETIAARRARVAEILSRLRNQYPDSTISLRFNNRIQLVVAVILSAQCTDAMVNRVTRKLFRTYRTVDDFAEADPAEFMAAIRSTGYYRQKTKNILSMGKAIRDRFGGRVPSTMEDLISLPGIGRKTANVVLHEAFERAEGIAVDTHVTRLSHLLRLSRRADAVGIERDLVRLVPRGSWGDLTSFFIDHGRAICIANRPQCQRCVLNDLCPSALRPLDGTLFTNPGNPGRGAARIIKEP